MKNIKTFNDVIFLGNLNVLIDKLKIVLHVLKTEWIIQLYNRQKRGTSYYFKYQIIAKRCKRHHSNGNYVSYNFMNKISLEYVRISNTHCVFMVGAIIFITIAEVICFIFSAVLHCHSQSAFFRDCGMCPIKSQMTLHHTHFLFLPLENSSFAFQRII